MTAEEFYLKEVSHLGRGLERETGKLDAVIFLGSTGALVLSINYIAGIKESLGDCEFFLLIISWLALLAALFLHTIAYRYSKRYHATAIKALKDWKEKNFTPPFFEQPKEVSKLNEVVILLTDYSLWFFTGGIALLFAFVILTMR